jgi:Coenzyme PQQ synthesis protein D (PqqD)
MTIALTDHLKMADEILSTRMDQETVILNLKTGMYHGLDPVGTRFFELLKSTGDLTEVHRQLLSEFDVPADRLEKDLLALSEEMLGKGILVVAKS